MQVHIGKLGAAVEVDFDTLPDNAKDYIIGYGLKQVLNDCHSSYKEADFDSREAFLEAVEDVVQAKAEALKQGDITIRGSGSSRAPADPIGKEAYRLAGLTVKAMLKKAGHALNSLPKGKLGELTQEHLEKNADAYRSQAEENLAAIREIEVDIDLSDLEA